MPDLEELIRDARLRPQQPDVQALRNVLAAAEADLVAASTVHATSPGWTEAILYEAGLRAARVIVQAAGFRIATDRAHATAIDAADALTSRQHHRRFVRLHRTRRVRHDFMYETPRDPSEQDLVQARADVDALLDLARNAVEALS